MLLAAAAIIFGIITLVVSADKLIFAASALAKKMGMSSLIVGLTIVSLGTSAPEVVVGIIASLSGNSGIAIGNAVGSNIANVAMVLGFSVILVPISIHSSVILRELPLLICVTAASYLLVIDRELSLADSLVMMVMLLLVVIWFVWSSMREDDGVESPGEEAEEITTLRVVLWLLLSVVLLYFSSRALVWGSVYYARLFGLSDVAIGLTIIAIGTSLPELATSAIAAIKGKHDMVIGNIVGSNIFNLATVLPIPGFFASTRISDTVVSRDFPVMILLTVILFMMAYDRSLGHKIINRWQGVLLLGVFIVYQAGFFMLS